MKLKKRGQTAHRSEVLCSLADLDATGAVGVERTSEPHEIVVVRSGAGVRGYVNSCPHKGTPLETFPGRFLDETGAHLICSTHGARFTVESGLCTFGPCRGQSLVAVPLEIHDGDVLFAPSPVSGPANSTD